MNSRLNENIDYWKIINDINWYQISKTNNAHKAIEKVCEICSDNYDFDTLVGLNNFTWEKKNILKNKFMAFFRSLPKEEKVSKYREFLSDDFLDDASSHIVGLGEIFYNYILDNIENVYMIRKDVVENFRYGICMAQEKVVEAT